MKKFGLFVLICGFFFASKTTKAQNLGFRLGLNTATYTGDTVSQSNIIGFQIGGVAEFDLVGPLKLDLNLIYNMKGARNNVFNQDVRNNYLELPVLLHANIAWVFVEAGPSFSYLLSASSDSFNIKENYKDIETGAILGVGFKLDEARIDIRYYTSLSQINEDIGELSIKNSVISFGFSYFL